MKQTTTGVKLSYFDFSGGRGEECRLALHIAGINFVDDRIDPKDWPSKKPSTPFGAMPVIEIEGEGVLAQSNAILGLIGTRHGLLPNDDFKAAQHRAILNAVEDLNMRIGSTMRIEDDEEKKKERQELAEGYMKDWANNMEKQIQGPFVAGENITVADVKLFVLVNWIKKGVLDHIPKNYFDNFSKLNTLFTAVATHPKVVEWYENKNPKS